MVGSVASGHKQTDDHGSHDPVTVALREVIDAVMSANYWGERERKQGPMRARGEWAAAHGQAGQRARTCCVVLAPSCSTVAFTELMLALVMFQRVLFSD